MATPEEKLARLREIVGSLESAVVAFSGGVDSTFVLAIAYLVPITARKGHTLGMRGRRIRVVRVDGSPVGWYPAFTRFALPILLALAIPSFGVILGLGMVAWGFFDRNGQGIHDKLARTLVVDA